MFKKLIRRLNLIGYLKGIINSHIGRQMKIMDEYIKTK